jgi:uncharacterized protein (DUF58 family)
LTALVLQAGLLAFAMYVLLGLLLLSRWLAKEWITGLTAKRESSTLEPAEIGDKVEIKVKVKNSGRITVAWLLLEDLLPEKARRQKRFRLKGKAIKIAMLRAGKTAVLKYNILCEMRGLFQIGPTILETGDLFGLHRRHRIVTQPIFLMVYPKVLPLPKYNFASQRPIGEVNMAHRLFEDPTRHAGVRPYQIGDPLQRVHWRATARTGEIMCKVYDPTSLAGATILLDFHIDSYHKRGEPHRSELGVTAACSIAYAVSLLNQQVGLCTNGKDAADRVRLNVHIQEGEDTSTNSYETREEAKKEGAMQTSSDRLRPMVVETRRGIEQFQKIRETLARIELTDGLPFARMVFELIGRIPRDATIIALLGTVTPEHANALGTLRRQGFAITVICLMMDESEETEKSIGRLYAEGIRDVRHLPNEEALSQLCEQSTFGGTPYSMAVAY